MKNSLKVGSLTALVLAIPALIIVDWFYKGYGIAVMFLFITIGVVCDQVVRMKYPNKKVRSFSNYQKNKLLNIFSLILFIQSPMALILSHRLNDKVGFWIMAVMVCLGITLNQVARIKFSYVIEDREEVR